MLINGGEIFYSSSVKRIKIEDKKVISVILEDGNEFESENVVSAIDAKTTFYKLMDPELIPPKFKNKLDTTVVSDTYFIVSITTDINPSEYGFDGSDVFINSSLDIAEAVAPNDPEKSSFHLNFPKYRSEDVNSNVHGIQIVFPVTFDFENYWITGPELQWETNIMNSKKNLHLN